jgi:hypothetical protein
MGERGAVRRMAVGGIHSWIHNVRHRARPSDVLLVATGAGLIPRNGRLFNRYTDHFAHELGNRGWTLEYLFANRWPKPPRAVERLGYLGGHRFSQAVQSRLLVRARHRALVADLVDVADRRGRDLLGWGLSPERRQALVLDGSRRLATYPMEARFWRNVFRRVRPRVILTEEGCYGHMAVFNHEARERGVVVAEFQHGMVTRGHDAYNVAPRLAADPGYGRTQPTAFLGYGSWWNGQFNAPVADRVPLGNPHRDETLRDWSPGVIRRTVLVLGDGIETDAYLTFCQTLGAAVPAGLDVVFRPHPMERARVVGRQAVSVDAGADLYESFRSAHAVVGEASTGLFEAVGLVDRIFVWDTVKSRFYLGDHPFARFEDAAGLAELLRSREAGMTEPTFADAMWAKDWRRRFSDFVANV